MCTYLIVFFFFLITNFPKDVLHTQEVRSVVSDSSCEVLNAKGSAVDCSWLEQPWILLVLHLYFGDITFGSSVYRTLHIQHT